MSSAWPLLNQPPELHPGQVHVWSLALDLADAAVAALERHLADDERDRAARYRFDRHRRRFVACRAQTRQLLARYLSITPEAVEFTAGPKGKPFLAAPWQASGIEFNVSHSHELALCAVTLRQELGVDIEHRRAPFDFLDLARHFFADEEVAELTHLPESDRLEAFLTCWTRKEAVLKAVGVGLLIPLNQVVVSLAPGDPAAVRRFINPDGVPQPWWLEHLLPAPDYLAAIASQGRPLQTSCWRFAPDVSNGTE